jgi:hypothetical protein
VIEFVDPNKTGEYRMTLDPSGKDALPSHGTGRPNGATPKVGATVQNMFMKGAVLLSVPLTAYGNHRIKVYTRMTGNGGRFQVFEDTIQGPAPLYTKVLPVLKGNYKFEIVIKDLDTNNQAADTIDIEVK